MPGSDAPRPTGQRWIADRYAANARFVADLAEPLIDILAPSAGDRILDLGCGDGALTEKILQSGASVIAVDDAPDQIAAAKKRGLDARVMDGQALTFENEFDAILTNAALHWMSDDPDAVIHGMWRALKPGGRVVGEMGGAGNVAHIVDALYQSLAARGIDGDELNPWYFPTDSDYRDRLEQRGFVVESIALIPRPTPLPGDIGDWLSTFAEGFLQAVPDQERTGFVDEVRDKLRPDLFQHHIWVADYMRLRFVAMRPEADG